MKILMIVAVLAFLAVAGFAIAETFESKAVSGEELPTCGSGFCDGACSAERSCGSLTCGASQGKACGCGK